MDLCCINDFVCSGVFSLASIKASIQAAVTAAAQQPEADRKKQIRQLQLRWHPGNLAFQTFVAQYQSCPMYMLCCVCVCC
jgi:hypothetical protein